MSQESGPSGYSNGDETGNSQKQNNAENSDSLCDEKSSTIESSDNSNGEEIAGNLGEEESDKDEIVYFEILPCDESSHEDESTQSDLESLVNVSVIYEFPDDEVETATFFDISEHDNINFTRESSAECDDASILEEAVVKFHSHQAAATASQISPTIVSKFSRDHKRSEDCVIEMAEEHSTKTSDAGISSSRGSVQINKVLGSLSKNSQREDSGKKRDFSHVTMDSEEDSDRRVKGRLHANSLHQHSKNSAVTASNSEDGFADIEDNADNSNGIKDDLLGNYKQFFQSRANIPTGCYNKTSSALCNADEKQSNDKEQFNNTGMHDNSFNPSAPSCSTSNNGLPASNFKNMHQLKAKSKASRKKGRRCHVCSKKLDLTAITCRCGGIFCAKHRYDKEHNCTFDYKAMGAKQIRKNNPQVIAEKISKI